MRLNSFFLVVIAITKGGHIPFSSWLSAVVAVTSPVSPLLDSSTLVTAGFEPKWVGVSLFYVRMETEPLAET